MKKYLLLISLIVLWGCSQNEVSEVKNESKNETIEVKSLDITQANRLAELPLKCMSTEYPNKTGHVMGGAGDVKTPSDLHPAFYGCFDWHSAVHGHWSLVYLLKEFPDLAKKDIILEKLMANLSAENIEKEVEYFSGQNKSFERTYGWAWLLKLAQELHTWDNPKAREMEANLRPLTNKVVQMYLDFLPKLRYPVRVGTHTNTAFGLSFAYDYAQEIGHDSLKMLIEKRAKDFYFNDINGPLEWEPSGYDFLSPCLEEADIMNKVLSHDEYFKWLQKFLPQLHSPDFKLEPGIVSDREDGHLVHLDGVNFSRAWCLYGIAYSYPEYAHLKAVADAHINYSLDGITDGNYEGGHWLASFALYSLKSSNVN